MLIAPATESDAPPITEIWNHYIRETIATFNSVEQSISEIEQMIADKSTKDHPFLVAREEDGVVGFATYGEFRSGAGYARVVEHTIQLRPDAQGKGVGRALMSRLEVHGKSHKLHSFFAGISGENIDGIKFHEAVGFEHVTTIPKVGWKFDCWHDLILMRKEL